MKKIVVKEFLKGAFLALLVSVSSCAKMDKISSIGASTFESDKIVAFLIYPKTSKWIDNSRMVFVGEKYRYVFSSDERLVRFLSLENKPKTNLRLMDFFSVRSNTFVVNYIPGMNHLTGRYKLEVDTRVASQEQIKALEKIGFGKDIEKYRMPNTLVMYGELKGKISTPGENDKLDLIELSESYPIEIERPASLMAQTARLYVGAPLLAVKVAAEIVPTGIFIITMPLGCISEE